MLILSKFRSTLQSFGFIVNVKLASTTGSSSLVENINSFKVLLFSISLDLVIKMKTFVILAAFLGLAFGHSEESYLKARLLKGYDRTTLPEGQTKVTIGFRPVDIGFCAHKQVNHL